jgi:hypothetical protein
MGIEQGAHVKVVLDTKQAKKDLQELAKLGEAAARRVSKQSSGGGALSNLGKGFGLGAGFALGKRVAGAVGVFGSIGDVFGDWTSGISADIDLRMGADKARARAAARQQTAQDTALHAFHTGDTAYSKMYYNHILNTKHMPQQVGAARIHKALGFGGKPASETADMGPLDKMMNSIVGGIRDGFDRVITALGG